MPIKVVLAEDNYLVREGVARLLETEPTLNLVAAVEDLPGLLAAVEEHSPEVVITDIRMPPTSTDEGIQASGLLRDSHPEIGVVVLSQYAEPEYALMLLEKGAAGRAYLLKERVSEIEQIRDAVEQVSKGGSVIDPKVVEVLVAAKARAKESPLERLVLTERAVEKHINSIFSKLALSEEKDVHRRVKAVLMFLGQI